MLVECAQKIQKRMLAIDAKTAPPKTQRKEAKTRDTHLPEGEKDHALDGHELAHGPEVGQQRLRGAVEEEQHVQRPAKIERGERANETVSNWKAQGHNGAD
jgi:hypothetical protein